MGKPYPNKENPTDPNMYVGALPEPTASASARLIPGAQEEYISSFSYKYQSNKLYSLCFVWSSGAYNNYR